MNLDENVWGKHYWFVLHTICLTYPDTPNKTIKKKYYEFYNNLHLFLPNTEIQKQFKKLLDEFPVYYYLDSKKDLIKWTNFIHNKINYKLNKKQFSETLSSEEYFNNYKSPEIKITLLQKYKEKILFIIILITIIFISLYN